MVGPRLPAALLLLAVAEKLAESGVQVGGHEVAVFQGPMHDDDLFEGLLAPGVVVDAAAARDVHLVRHRDFAEPVLLARPRPIATGMPERLPHRHTGGAAARRAKRKGRR